MAAALHEFNYKDFTDKKLLGEGEFGRVYAVKHTLFPKLAVRVISRRFFPRGGEHDMLRKEAKELFSIVSEQFVRFLGVVMEPDHLCLVFEYAAFGSLDKVLTRHPMPWPLKIRIAYEIALGMCFLHDRQLLHSRLKCKNVLIAENIHVKISDLSFHSSRGMNTWTRYANAYSQSIGGQSRQSNTIDHVPPELIRDINASPDKSADVYAYGIILWQILTDKTPYEGLSSSAICDEVVSGTRPQERLIRDGRPDIIYSLMLKCWANRKQDRPSFEQALRELTPKFNETEHEARKLALICQKDIDTFYFPMGAGVQPPHGDVHRAPIPHVTPPEAGTIAEMPESVSEGDGSAVSVSVRDEIAERKLDATPFHQSQTASGATVRAQPATTGEDDGSFVIPGENSSRQATAQDLYRVAEHMGKTWRRFGRYLGFSDGQLDNIEMNYGKSGYPEVPYQMLRKWREKIGSLTISYLVKKLKSGDLSNVAAYLDP